MRNTHQHSCRGRKRERLVLEGRDGGRRERVGREGERPQETCFASAYMRAMPEGGREGGRHMSWRPLGFKDEDPIINLTQASVRSVRLRLESILSVYLRFQYEDAIGLEQFVAFPK